MSERNRSKIKFKGLVIAFMVSFTFSVVVCSCVSAASMWSRTYGGTGYDAGTGETVQTSTGGYVISGDTNSSGSGGMDFWLFETDADGNMLWNKTYGGVLDEVSGDMCQTSDGGYALAGYTTSFGAGGQDVWFVKTNSVGDMQWYNTYGGVGDEWVTSVVQTLDGGYALFGFTESFGAGIQDLYLIKTDANGNMEWNQTYGGTGNETDGYAVVQTSDGGYAMVGSTNSFGAGNFDVWLVKADSGGNMQWNQTHGGTGIDAGYDLIQTSDGGYAITGYTASFGGVKAYLVKADSSGNMQWNKTYSTLFADIGLHVIQTADGGYAIVGWNYANGQDLVLYKTDVDGNLEWNMTYGGTGVENGFALLQTSDGGYVLTGSTDSFGAGGTDIWLVKVDEYGVVPEGLTIIVVLLLSTVAAIVGIRYLCKQPRLESF